MEQKKYRPKIEFSEEEKKLSRGYFRIRKVSNNIPTSR